MILRRRCSQLHIIGEAIHHNGSYGAYRVTPKRYEIPPTCRGSKSSG
jgi:hypothetical protein